MDERFSAREGFVEGSQKRQQSVTSDWTFLIDLIAGVQLREVKNVPKEDGYLTEIFRSDWQLDEGIVAQVFQVMLIPGALSAWHMHRYTTDRLFVTMGQIKIVLYDGRETSSTYRCINEFRLGSFRPGLLVVPPGVWHGVQNISDAPSLIVNLVDRAYTYEDPDHWALPPDSGKIPYHFT